MNHPKRFAAIWGGVLALLLLATPAFAQPITDLVLCLDASGSMNSQVGNNQTRWDIERDGSASALEDPLVVPRNGTVRVTVIQFSNNAQVEVSPTIVDSAQTAAGIAADVRAIQPFFNGTNIASCIDLAVDQLQTANPVGHRQVIDVSTDGLPTVPSTTEGAQAARVAADAAIAAGVDAVNGLGILLGQSGTDFLERMVRPQPAGGMDGFVVSIDDIAEYRDELAAKIVREISGCLSIADGALRILCPGDGGDRFQISLTFTNQTEDELHHLFVLEDPLAPLPPGVIVLDDYFDFSGDPVCSPIDDPAGCSQADATRTIEVTVRGQANAAFELLLTAHDQTLAECCSVTVPIELPACDCAQILDQGISCQLGAGDASWKLDLSLQNLTDQEAQHVLLTPSSPRGVTFSPNHFLSLGLDPVSPAGGGVTALSTFLGGPDAAAGREICFDLSLHDARFDQCCAIEHCVTLPSCIAINQHVNWNVIGNSLYRLDDRFLRVTNLSDDSRSGIGFQTPLATDFAANWQPLTPTSPETTLLVGSRGVVDGVADQPITSLRGVVDSSGARIVPRSTVARFDTVEVRREGETVGTFRLGRSRGIQVPSGDSCTGVQFSEIGINVIVIWPQAVEILPDGFDGAPLLGDEVVFIATTERSIDGLTTVNVRAGGVSEIAFDRVEVDLVEN